MKYIYHNKNLRCKISWGHDEFTFKTLFILQLQRKKRLWFYSTWCDCFNTLKIELDDNVENFLHAGESCKDFSMPFQTKLEVWPTEKFDMRKRVNELFESYLKAVSLSKNQVKSLARHWDSIE
jgi:hypothetical protein